MSTIIRTGDPDAIERLQEKLEALNKTQDAMKTANRIFRNKKMHHDIKIMELVKLGINKEDAESRLVPRWGGEIGFRAYELTNNNAEIKCTMKRIAQCKAAAKRTSRIETIHGVEIEWDAEGSRVRMTFPETRVSRAMYDTLRRNGFVFARSIGAFSRMWTNNDAKYKVQWVLDAYKKEQGETAG